MTASNISGDEAVMARIKSLPGAMRPRIRRIIEAFANDVTKLTKEKLSDEVLNVRSGHLRRSITPDVKENGSAITGTVGTNVIYARPLELGLSGAISVRSFMRQQTKAFGRSITPRAVSVKAYTRNVDIKPRHFLRDSLREASPSLVERLRKVGAIE